MYMVRFYRDANICNALGHMILPAPLKKLEKHDISKVLWF